MEVVFGVGVGMASWWATRRISWNGDWRSSALALVVCGVDEGVGRRVRAGGDAAGKLYRKGEEVMVRLGREEGVEGCWRFEGS